MHFESALKDRDICCSSNVIRQAVPYRRFGTTKGVRSNFRAGWTQMKLPVIDCGSQQMSTNLPPNAGSQICWFTRLQKLVRQSVDLIIYAPLDRKLMKLLQCLGDADTSPLTCDNTGECALQTLETRDVFNWDPHEGQVEQQLTWEQAMFLEQSNVRLGRMWRSTRIW